MLAGLSWIGSISRKFFSARPPMLIALAGSLLAGNATQPAPLPAGWEVMEIESKWEITDAQYSAMVDAFGDRQSRYGYPLRVRWDGISRRFVDIYYDSLGGELAAALHSLRHRARYQSRPDAADNSEPALHAANWRLEWESVQYKSTPCRIDATWFRRETGACRIRDEAGEELCVPGQQVDPAPMLAGAHPSHDGMAALRSDHGGLSLGALRPVLHVSDYRYRVVFQRDGRDLFELSLDRLYSTDLVTGARTVRSLEAELEIIAESWTEADVRALLDVSRRIQRDFNLEPSIHSKGGLEVPACPATTARAPGSA